MRRHPVMRDEHVKASIAAVKREFGGDFCLAGRKASDADGRWLCWLVLKFATDIGAVALGTCFGVHHTTILNGWRRAIDLMRCYPDFRARYDRIVETYLKLAPK